MKKNTTEIDDSDNFQTKRLKNKYEFSENS